jgi:hypothetical protein
VVNQTTGHYYSSSEDMGSLKYAQTKADSLPTTADSFSEVPATGLGLLGFWGIYRLGLLGFLGLRIMD